MDELAGRDAPFRPFAEGNGWYARYSDQTGDGPAYKRVSRGDYAELWCRLI